MKLPFTEEQWKAAHKAGITDENYLEEDIGIYQDMLDAVNAMFED